MAMQIARWLLLMISIACLSGCALNVPGMPNQAAQQPTALGLPAAARTAIAANEKDLSAEVERRLGEMTLEQKVGQLLVVAFREDTVSPAISEMVRDRHVGGVILFTLN